jgi:ParB-like chromosome segregation protein Spo0J
MRAGEVYIDAVTVPSGRRPVNSDTVERLVESIGKIGLQQPISVWSPDSETVVLVAGNHRLEACRRLDMHKVPAVFVDMDERQRRMWEIAENLHRAELTVLERDEQVSEWIKLAATISRQPDEKIGRGRPEGGRASASREINVSEPDARRAEQVASLTPEAKDAARETGQADNRSALLEAAKQAPERQADYLRDRAASKRTRNALDDKMTKEDANERLAEWLAENSHGEQWATLSALIYAAGYTPLGKAFNRLVGTPVFDSSEAGR